MVLPSQDSTRSAGAIRMWGPEVKTHHGTDHVNNNIDLWASGPLVAKLRPHGTRTLLRKDLFRTAFIGPAGLTLTTAKLVPQVLLAISVCDSMHWIYFSLISLSARVLYIASRANGCIARSKVGCWPLSPVGSRGLPLSPSL